MTISPAIKPLVYIKRDYFPQYSLKSKMLIILQGDRRDARARAHMINNRCRNIYGSFYDIAG